MPKDYEPNDAWTSVYLDNEGLAHIVPGCEKPLPLQKLKEIEVAFSLGNKVFVSACHVSQAMLDQRCEP